MEFPVSDELKALLGRQMTHGRTVGAVKPSIMGWANDLIDEGGFDEDHSPSSVREGRPKRKPRVRKLLGTPGWYLIDCVGL